MSLAQRSRWEDCPWTRLSGAETTVATAPTPKVRIRLPDGTRATKVRLLAAGKTLRTERSSQDLNVTVPSILDHEIVAIDL